MMRKGLLCALVFCMSALVYAQDDTPKVEDDQRLEVQRLTHDGKQGGSFTLPHYPEKAVKMRQEGKAIIYVWVSPEGKAKSLGVYKSSGYSEFDEAAMETVSEGRFLKTGTWTVYLIPVQFQLE